MHSPNVYYSLGSLYSKLGNLEQAVGLLEQFLKMRESPEAHFEIAKVLASLGKYTEAAVHLSRAIEIDTEDDARYYHERARVYEAMDMVTSS